MKRVMKRVGTTLLGVALILPAAAASTQRSTDAAAAASSQTDVCADGENRQPMTVSAEYVWRLRAYDDLDCALAILDQALKAPGSAVMLSRQEAERARARVWSARDAAARIGR